MILATVVSSKYSRRKTDNKRQHIIGITEFCNAISTYGYMNECKQQRECNACISLDICVELKVQLDVPLPRQMKYSRATEVFIQWRDCDSRQVYGLSFWTSDAADGFQQWLDYAINPPAVTPTPTKNAPPPAPHATSSSSLSAESHYQRPQPRPAPSKQTSNGPDIIDSHQLSVICDIFCIITLKNCCPTLCKDSLICFSFTHL